jgi:hypothetical protein
MDNICLPVQLDTFILNEQVCNEGSTLIAPITLPNYVSLRLSNAVIQVNKGLRSKLRLRMVNAN